MPYKQKVVFEIKNFRSVMQGNIEIKPITVLTGANGAGKSTFMYAIMALRNILFNANQPANNFFNFGFANLGGIKEVVTGKNIGKSIELACHYSDATSESSYIANIGPSSSLRLTVKKPFQIDLMLDVSFPYPLVQSVAEEIVWKGKKYVCTFNGVRLNIVPRDGTALSDAARVELAVPADLTQSVALLSEYVDVKRGFFQNTYAPLKIASNGEEQVASLLGADRDLEARISVVLEKMTNKSFAARQTALGAASFYLQTVDRKTGFVCDLVNETFGINQLVYLLSMLLKEDLWLLCIEEPEIHLHPEALTKLTGQFLEIAKTRDKRLLISSHSEHFVVSLLNLIAQGKATPDDIGIYFVAKDANNLTRVVEQTVNEKGQIEGGLKSFYEPSIRALEDFLGSATRH